MIHLANSEWGAFNDRPELFLGLAQVALGAIAFLAQLGFIEGPAYGERQALQFLFQDIIGGAFFDALHGQLIPKRAGYQDERDIQPGLSQPAHGLEATPSRQVVVSQDDVIGIPLKIFGELLKIGGNVGFYFQTRLFGFPEGQLGVRWVVLQDKHPNYICCICRHIHCYLTELWAESLVLKLLAISS